MQLGLSLGKCSLENPYFDLEIVRHLLRTLDRDIHTRFLEGPRLALVDDEEPDSRLALGGEVGPDVAPLPQDSTLIIRPRSALGLKYVELTPGDSDATFARGDTIPLGHTSEPLEIEDVFSTFDDDMRTDAREATEGFGDAFAGRGQSINDAIRALNPFFTHLTPVMQNLADPETELDEFFLQIGRASAQAAPVAEIQAELFTNMADTFAAISSDPEALQLTIEKQPATLDTAIQSFRVQRPFLADFTDLSRRLRPAAQELPRSLPAVNTALRVGTPILPRTVELNEDLRRVVADLQGLCDGRDQHQHREQRRADVAEQARVLAEVRARAAAGAPALAVERVRDVTGQTPLVVQLPDDGPQPRDGRQRGEAEVGAVQVVQLDDGRRPEPRVGEHAERRRVEDVLQAQEVEELARGAVEHAPEQVPLQRPDVGVVGHLASDEHPRRMPEAVQARVELVRRPAGTAGGVGLADVQHVQRHERQS